MKKILLSLFIVLILAVPVTPAFAQGSGNGDVLCTGGNSTINSGETTDNVLLFGCNGTVKSGATVNGDIGVFGGNLTIENGAKVNGNVALFGGNVNLAGQVQGDVAIMGGALHLDSGSVVNGSVHVFGGGLSRDEGAVVRGGVSNDNNFRFTPGFGRVFVPRFGRFGFDPFGFFGWIITALAFTALGVLLVVFFPQPTRRVMATAQQSFGQSLGVGCLTLLVAPMLCLLLLITLIGPFLLALALAAAWVFGWTAIGFLAGERILEAFKVRDITPILAVLIGVLILSVVGQVPCVGWLIGLFVGAVGVGAVMLTRFGTRAYPYMPAWAAAGPYGPVPPAPTATLPPPPAPSEPPPATPAGGVPQS